MKMKKNENNQIQNKIHDELVGQKVFKCELTIGSIVFIILDCDYSLRENLPFGNQHIHLYLCMWRIETEDQVLVASEDSIEKITIGIETLVGKSITSFEIDHPSMDATIIFDGKFALRTFAVTCNEMDKLWSIRYPDGKHLSVFVNNHWIYEP